jgi:hypothetical protein
MWMRYVSPDAPHRERVGPVVLHPESATGLARQHAGSTHMEITQEQALRRFPELHALTTVRKAGWTFRLIGDRDKGLDGIVASYSSASSRMRSGSTTSAR